MFILDLLLLSGVCGIAYGCFWCGAKYGTLKKLGGAIKTLFADA